MATSGYRFQEGIIVIIRDASTEELEQAASDICDFYCRYPLLWDEQLMGQELQESEICKNCPLNILQTGVMIE